MTKIRKIARILWRGKTVTRHYIGFPTDVVDPADTQRDFSPARILVLHERTKGGGYFLYRFATDGTFAGDTWHPNVAEAEEQAIFEYGDALGPWQDIPSIVTDVQQFVQQCAREEMSKTVE